MWPPLQKALEGFIPTVGNSNDLQIVQSLTNLKRKLSAVDNEAFRKAQSSRNESALTPKMQEIQRFEGNLVKRILDRNFDF